jgi:aryl-alcohol dehydrogenase-like predicted oxidoreductase
MDDLVRQGKVRYIGCSNFRAWEVAHAMGASRLQGLEHWTAVQNRWNLLDGLDSPELEQAADALRLGIIPYTPLASGILTGKYRRGEEPAAGTRIGDFSRMRERLTDDKLERTERVRTWAEERGHTAAEAAIAWLLAHPVVPSVIAGARRPEQIDANIRAAGWTMTPEERDELTAIATS